MADYQAQIRLGIQGLGQLRELEQRLLNATDLLNNLQNASSIVGQAGSSAGRRVDAAVGRRIAAQNSRADAQRIVGNVASQSRMGDTNATTRRLANANLRVSEREVRESDRALREELQNQRLINAANRRYVRAIDRATDVVGNVQERENEQRTRLQGTLRDIGQASRGNLLTNRYRGRQAEFLRGGGGRELSPELQQQARNVQEAWRLATVGGRENLQLMQRISAEMTGLVREQNEFNRARSGRSIGFEEARRGQERIDVISQRPGVNPARVGRLRAQAADVISAGNRGDIAGARDATRRMKAGIMRYTRELDAAAKTIKSQQRAGIRNLTVNQNWQRALDEGAQALREIRGGRLLPSDKALEQRVALSQQPQPTRLDTLKAEADRRQAEEAKRAAGSVGRFAAAAEREARRLERLGIGQPRRGVGRQQAQGGAIPMGGTDGQPFNRLPFPAGPGNERGIAQFRGIQRQQQGRPTGLFQGNAREAISSGLIGGGFPLLFGQGAGGAIGGGLGGVAGGFLGGGFGFGVSIVGTVLGTAVDTATNNLKTLADALKSPNDAITALEANGYRVSDSLKFQVQQLQSVGRAYDAQTLVLQEVEKRLGPGGITELRELDAAQKQLQEQWAAVASEIQVRLLPVLQGFVEFLGSAADSIEGFASQSRLQRLDPQKFEELRTQAIRETARGPFGAFGNKDAFDARLDSLTKQELSQRFAGERQSVPLTPQETFASETTRIQESRKQADQIQSAYREAFKLQRQVYDLQRNGADINRDIADYAYNKQREIFNLQQQAAEQQITNFRDSARNRIEGQDLDLREAFAGATGFEQQLLSAARESMRVRKEGEADIEAGRRRLELAMARIQKDSDDYSRTTAREIEDIERRKLAYVRSVEDFKMQVADYQLARAREAADLMRQAMSMTDMGSASGSAPYVAASPTQRIPFMSEIDRAAREANVDPRLLAGLVKQESSFNPNARSGSGAIGLAQLMPGTARELGVDPLNIQDNLRGGARYLRQMIDQFGLEGGLRAYNQGPGAQRRTPAGNSRESREYPGLVLANARGFGFNPAATASASATGGMGGGAFGRTGRMDLRPGYGMVDLRGGTRQTITADAMDAIVNRAAMNMRTWIGGDGITDVEATNLRGDALRRAVEDGIRRHETRRSSPATAIDLIAKEGEPLGIPVGGIRNMGGNTGVGGTTARGTLAIHLPLSSIGQGATSMEAMTATQTQSVPIPQMRDVSLMDTPSAAPLNAERLAVAARLAGGLQEAQKLLEDQAKLRERGVELSQLEAILQSNQVPELQDQYSVLQKQLEARRQGIGLIDEETAAADLRAQSEVRLARIETDRKNALAKIGGKVTDPAELAEAQGRINRLSQAAADIAKNEEGEKKKILEATQQLQNAEQVRNAIQRASQELATEQAIAAALLRGETEATAVELLKAQDFYQKATDAEKQILESKIAQTDELRKQNQINQQTNQLLKDARFTGAGLRSGLIGPAAAGFEDVLRAGGSQAQALERAAAAQALQDQELIWGNLAKDITAVSDAIAGGLTQGLADVITGARTMKEVGREVLDSIAGTFLDTAQQQLSTMLQRSFASVLGGEGGVLTSLFGAGAGATATSGPAALGAAATAAAPPLMAVASSATAAAASLSALSAANGIASTGGLLGGLASQATTTIFQGAAGSAFSAAAPNLLGSFFGGASPLPLNFLPGLAGGGDAEAGHAYKVGEVGPELFIPGVSGRVVKNSDVQKAARLQEANDDGPDGEINVRYDAKTIAGERYVTEDQFRKGMTRAAQQGRAMAYSGMRNSGSTRKSIGI